LETTNFTLLREELLVRGYVTRALLLYSRVVSNMCLTRVSEISVVYF